MNLLRKEIPQKKYRKHPKTLVIQPPAFINKTMVVPALLIYIGATVGLLKQGPVNSQTFESRALLVKTEQGESVTNVQDATGQERVDSGALLGDSADEINAGPDDFEANFSTPSLVFKEENDALADSESLAEISRNSSVNKSPVASQNSAELLTQLNENLLSAISDNNVDLLLAMLGSETDRLLENGETALMKAAWEGKVDMASALEKSGASVNFRSVRGLTPLHYAAIQGHSRMVELLIDLGAKINTATPDGKTPLMAAAWNSHSQVVRVLINAGAKVNRADKSNRTALYYAVSAADDVSANALLAAGADPDRRDVAGVSISTLARQKQLNLEAL